MLDKGPYPRLVQVAKERSLAKQSGFAEHDIDIVHHRANEDVASIIAHWQRVWRIHVWGQDDFAGWDEDGAPIFDSEDAVVFDNIKVAKAELKRVRRAGWKEESELVFSDSKPLPQRT